MEKIPLIQSQLQPPVIREKYIRRNKLSKKMADIPKQPLTILYAGAGFGKSTALSLFVHDGQSDACWYTISRQDDELLPFLTKLFQAVKPFSPSFKDSILEDMVKIHIEKDKVYEILSVFINEIIELEEEVVLILDDFHHAMNSEDIKRSLLFLIEHIPANLHIVVSTRYKPKWEVITKLKMKGELLEISQQELALSLDEMHYIAEDVFQLSLPEEDLKYIHQLTEGWTIAFNMVMQQLQDGTPSVKDIFQNRQESLEDLFHYLASEVLTKQSLIIQQFLIQSSVLEVLSPDSCDHVLQINGSNEILKRLLKQNLFIAEGEGGYYRYHALFKVFLENQLMLKYPDEHKDLHMRAAAYFNKKEDMEAALFHYEKVKAYKVIAHQINKHGEALFRAGKTQIVYDLAVKLPKALKEMYPAIYFFQGEMERYRSLYDQAEENYDKIIEFIPKEDPEYYYLSGLAYEGKARIYLDTIQPDKAERYVNQAIRMREKSGSSKKEMALLYVLMAENLLNAGKAVKAEMWYDRAKFLNLPVEDSNLQARIYLRTGSLAKAKEILLEKKEKNKLMQLPKSHRETDILLSIIEVFMGNLESSKSYASEGIQLGLSVQSPFVEACGWMRMGHAAQLIGNGEMKTAIKCYKTSLSIMEKINVSRGMAEPYMGLSILYGKNREYNMAIKSAKYGLKETEKVKDRWLSALIKLGIGITEIYNGIHEQAQEIINEARTDLVSCGDRYGVMVTWFWSAYLSLKNKQGTFKSDMEHFLQEVQREGYDFFLKRKTLFGPADMNNFAPMLIKAKQLEIEPPLVNRLLYELGYGDMDNHPGYTLVIQTFGQLNILLGEQKIEPQDWQRGKAKELFELFITFKDRWLLKEEILQLLWPDENEETANKKFKVALNSLLKTIEPNRRAREESFYIKRKGGAYGLNHLSGYQLDTRKFEEWVQGGLEEKEPKRSKEKLENGLELYRGDYLSDLQYAEWPSAERERLKQLYLRGAEKMAQNLVRLFDFNHCIVWCERILAVDHTWEEAYRLLMYSYYQKNNRPQAMKWYDKCSSVLETEFGVEPMDATKDMYDLLMDSG